MELKIKKMCKLTSSEISNNFDDYVGFLKKFKFVCAKCGRVSVKKKFLCNAVKVKKEDK